MAGQFDRYGNNTGYCLLTPNSTSLVNYVGIYGQTVFYSPSDTSGVRPSLNLKSNVVITGGDGTKNNPFTLDLQ